MRSAEASRSSSRAPSAHLFLLFTTRMRARSPGAVRGTNTTRPSGRSPTPAPPAARPRTSTSAVSAAAWNALLVGLGLWLGANLELLQDVLRGYAWAVGGLIAVVVLAAWSRRRRAV